MSLAEVRAFESSGLCRETGRGWVSVVIATEAFNLGSGEGGEVLPFTAVKPDAGLSLKKPVLINGACTIDGMAGRRKAGAAERAAWRPRSLGDDVYTRCWIAVNRVARSGLSLRRGNVSPRQDSRSGQ